MSLRMERAAEELHGTLTKIAHAAKRHWGYPERWMELWRDVLTITPSYIAENEVYIARLGDEVVGFYALVGSGAKLTLDHLWLSPRQIGTGIGRSLFNHAVTTARQLGAVELEVEADPNALGFYERMGAKRVGENVYELDGQPRVLPLLVYKLA
ncbi:MAG TPA: GNAT family N-acetyltransferase [Blastocatellia bacterium]|nr:GNAT family N-acetyltransferase [Blastocatellia bacterium]